MVDTAEAAEAAEVAEAPKAASEGDAAGVVDREVGGGEEEGAEGTVCASAGLPPSRGTGGSPGCRPWRRAVATMLAGRRRAHSAKKASRTWCVAAANEEKGQKRLVSTGGEALARP